MKFVFHGAILVGLMNSVFEEKILKLKRDDNYRELKIDSGIDFSSNDYLGMSNHPKIKESLIKALNSGIPIGSSGSRLLTGNKKEHQELEEYAAKYFNSEATLFFSSGFLANYAIFTTLPQRKDFIIFDELSHASIRDGIQASLAKSIKFKHNDLNDLKEKIANALELNAQNIWVAIESVYSMDGDIADIQGIINLIKNYNNIYLIIDEAHATGIFGANGKGFTYNLNYENLITLHTCSKAIAVSGALVCASKEIIEYMINKSRPFIFTTAESPLIAVAVKKSLQLLEEENWRRERLLELIEYINKNYQNTSTQIIPVLLKDSLSALNAASFLQENGFDVRAIRPPTVAVPRLRISLNINRSEKEIDGLFENINKIMGQQK